MYTPIHMYTYIYTYMYICVNIYSLPLGMVMQLPDGDQTSQSRKQVYTNIYICTNKPLNVENRYIQIFIYV
jgi:hypothetical protein